MWGRQTGPRKGARKSRSLLSARRDAVVLTILIAAVLLLLWNGSSFFTRLTVASTGLASDIRVTSIALTLNVALILFGWRRYVDLQHEAEMRAEGERRAALLATTDSITGLLNRKGFADAAEALALTATDEACELAILSLQLHRLKVVSDRHGYDVGDEFLKAIAAALAECSGEGAIVARMSGDEFAIAFTIGKDGLTEAERRGNIILRAVTRPFHLAGNLIQVGAYLGVASASPSTVGVPDLLRRADIALDHAKNGRNARPVWFDEDMEHALVAQGEIEQGIRHGLEHGEFVPFFEPQVELETGRIVGFEVLARWKHPLSGIIAPDLFIPVAEEIGLIGRLSEQVIGEALRQAVGWDHEIKISVNISPSQLADGWLAQRIVRMLTETGFPAERLVIEITESSLFSDLEMARSIVTSLKNQGMRLALDDFGTGFSSLSHLRSLPFDLIKIDRSFVSNIHTNRESLAIVRAVTALAAALSVPVLVEGIENEPAFETVLGLGCGIGQGWYFGKPMPAEQAAQLLTPDHGATDAKGDPARKHARG